MEEKILIKGIFSKTNVFSLSFLAIGFILFFSLVSISANPYSDDALCSVIGYSAIICLITSFILYLSMKKCEIAVTDKRVYGKAAFGKRVDLPIDKISSVAICAFKGVSVATSSGKISFLLCNNRDDVFDTISKLLVERQDKQSDTVIKQEVHQSNADELKKYKDLLDSGVITQEEFDQKKKQLLGL